MKFSDYCDQRDDEMDEYGGPSIDPNTLEPLYTKLRAERDFRFTPEWVISFGDMSIRLDAYLWCAENCKGRFALDKGRAFFTEYEDAVMFRLIWSGS